MYESVLVADRGETARRVIRTVRRLGMKAVAVYADADGSARHVHEADEAVLLGSGPQDVPYRDIRALIEAAQRCGCEAVHPGCGALAASPSFAEAVAEAGLVWVGPAPRTLAAIADPAVLAGAVGAVGATVDISAVTADAAGAGTGDAAGDVAFVVPVLAGEDETVGLPPRQLIRPGRPVVECPVPGLSAACEASAVRTAVRAARALELRGLAAVTMVFDRSDLGSDREPGPAVARLWPALDMDHPVVEAVTGLDLVEQQIRISTGGTPSLPSTSEFRAAALAELRVATSRDRPTRISHWREPERENVRVDSGFAEGDSVPPGGPRVVATITGTGRRRDEALAALADALGAFEVAGIAVDLDDAQQEVARRRAPGSEERQS